MPVSGPQIYIAGAPANAEPAGPLTATAFPFSKPPSVGLEIADTTVGTSPVRVERLDPDGAWQPVRNAEPAKVTGGSWSGADYEVPFDVPVRYRMITADGTIKAGVVVTDAGPASSLTLSVDRVWLIHPGVPTLSQPLQLRGWGPMTPEARGGVFHPAGGGLPIALSAAREAPSSELEVGTDTHAKEDGLRSLLADGGALLLNVPVGLGWNVPTGWIWVGGYSVARELVRGNSPRRVWKLPYNVVARPLGSSQTLWNWTALLAEQTSWETVLQTYSTWADLAAHRQR